MGCHRHNMFENVSLRKTNLIVGQKILSIFSILKHSLISRQIHNQKGWQKIYFITWKNSTEDILQMEKFKAYDLKTSNEEI